MTPPRSDAVSGGEIEAVLAAHDMATGQIYNPDQWNNDRGGYYVHCRCGDLICGHKDRCTCYPRHVAAQVLARLDARLAEGDVVEAVMDVTDFRTATAALTAVRGVLGGEGS